MKLSKSERKIFRQQLGLEFQKIRRRKKLSLEAPQGEASNGDEKVVDADFEEVK